MGCAIRRCGGNGWDWERIECGLSCFRREGGGFTPGTTGYSVAALERLHQSVTARARTPRQDLSQQLLECALAPRLFFWLPGGLGVVGLHELLQLRTH